jgi:hypothetical protein
MYERGELNRILAVPFHVFGPNRTKDGTIPFFLFVPTKHYHGVTLFWCHLAAVYPTAPYYCS